LRCWPNNAPGWNGRVIWTLDISQSAQAEVISQFGLPWMRQRRRRRFFGARRRTKKPSRLQWPADDSRQPHVRRVVGRRHFRD